MNKKLFIIFLSILAIFIVSCSNKITSSQEEKTDNPKTKIDNSTPITKSQILNVFESLNQFDIGGETWDFSAITDLTKLYNYKDDIYNSLQLESSTAGNASVNELVKKFQTELIPKFDEIGIYFPEDVTTLWGDPDSTRPLHLWFKLASKNGYKADSEIEQLFNKDLMIIFITKNKWK